MMVFCLFFSFLFSHPAPNCFPLTYFWHLHRQSKNDIATLEYRHQSLGCLGLLGLFRHCRLAALAPTALAPTSFSSAVTDHQQPTKIISVRFRGGGPAPTPLLYWPCAARPRRSGRITLYDPFYILSSNQSTFPFGRLSPTRNFSSPMRLVVLIGKEICFLAR